MGQKSVDIFRHPIAIVHSFASPSRTSVCKRVTARQRGFDVESHELRIRKYDAKVIRALNIKGKHNRGHKCKTTVASWDQVP